MFGECALRHCQFGLWNLGLVYIAECLNVFITASGRKFYRRKGLQKVVWSLFESTFQSGVWHHLLQSTRVEYLLLYCQKL